MISFPKFQSGFFLGFGAGFIARDLLASEQSYARPLVKGVIKTSYWALEKGRESFAHFFETVEDLVAEVRSESKLAAEAKAMVSEVVSPELETAQKLK